MRARRLLATGIISGLLAGLAIGTIGAAAADGAGGTTGGPAIYRLVDGTGPERLVIIGGIGAEDDSRLRLVDYSPERVTYRPAEH